MGNLETTAKGAPAYVMGVHTEARTAGPITSCAINILSNVQATGNSELPSLSHLSVMLSF